MPCGNEVQYAIPLADVFFVLRLRNSVLMLTFKGTLSFSLINDIMLYLGLPICQFVLLFGKSCFRERLFRGAEDRKVSSLEFN